MLQSWWSARNLKIVPAVFAIVVGIIVVPLRDTLELVEAILEPCPNAIDDVDFVTWQVETGDFWDRVLLRSQVVH